MCVQSSKAGIQILLRRQQRSWTLAAAFLAALAAAVKLSRAQEAEIVPAVTQSSAQQRQAPWNPKLYAFDMEASDAKSRSLAEEAGMLRELGFDGVAYLLWIDQAGSKLRTLGDNLDQHLRTLDEAGLPLLGVGASVNVNPNERPYDSRLVDAIRKLQGRPVTIGVMLGGLAPGDERGVEPAVKALRQLGDQAAKANLRIAVYHHVGSWAQSFDDALRVVKEADHDCVGVYFNACHWLAADADKDYRSRLRASANKIFAVTINGAKVGSTTIPELVQPLDQGDFDNRKLLSTLRQIGYRGPIGLQCFGIPGDAREHLQRSMNVWKTWKAEWAKVGAELE